MIYDVPIIMGNLNKGKYCVWHKREDIRRDKWEADGTTIEDAISNYQKKTGYTGPIVFDAFPPWRLLNERR